MTTFDPIPGKALLVVIAQSENLSAELKAKIHCLSTPWKTHQPDVNDQIRNLISQDRHLQQLYQDAYDTLESQRAALFVSSQVFYKGCTSEALYKLLDWDGTVGLLIGSGFAMYLAGKEIIKLFEISCAACPLHNPSMS